MALIVQKYGGSSVGTLDRICQVSHKIIQAKEQGHNVVVVVSAMYGETDRLIQLAHALTEQPNPRDYDVLISTGEQVAMSLLSMSLNAKNHPARCFTGTQIGLYTDSVHTKARILRVGTEVLHRELQQGHIVIVAGFQGVSESGDITTLGRGGSDATAVAIAIAVQADECQIYTDVDGIYTTDPHFLSEARLLPYISFEEMLEMASLGSKVLQMRSVELANRHQMPIRVLSTFSSGKGTLVLSENKIMHKHPVSGIAFSRDEVMFSLSDIPYRLGIEGYIIQALTAAQIEMDMMMQHRILSEKVHFSFTTPRRDYLKAQKLIEELSLELGNFVVNANLNVAKLSLVGIGIRSHAETTHKIFTALSSIGVSVLMVSTSEIKVSIVIDEVHLTQGVRVLHTTFELDKLP